MIGAIARNSVGELGLVTSGPEVDNLWHGIRVDQKVVGRPWVAVLPRVVVPAESVRTLFDLSESARWFATLVETRLGVVKRADPLKHWGWMGDARDDMGEAILYHRNKISTIDNCVDVAAHALIIADYARYMPT